MEDMFYEAAHLGGFAARFAYASQVGYYTRINVVYALKQIDHSMYIIGGEAMESCNRGCSDGGHKGNAAYGEAG